VCESQNLPRGGFFYARLLALRRRFAKEQSLDMSVIHTSLPIMAAFLVVPFGFLEAQNDALAVYAMHRVRARGAQ